MDKKEYFYSETKTIVSMVKRGLKDFKEGYSSLHYLVKGLWFGEDGQDDYNHTYYRKCIQQYTNLFLSSDKNEKETAENFFKNGFK